MLKPLPMYPALSYEGTIAEEMCACVYSMCLSIWLADGLSGR